jgi:hypothetical protein
MRIAWFSASAGGPPDPSDDAALLIRALSSRHSIERIDAARAHDFVWQHGRQPFDVCVFELGGTAAHQFIVPYAIHYPGIVLLRGVPRHDRALRSARLVVVPHEPVAQAIADDYPGARVRTLVPGVEPLAASPGEIVNALRWPPDGAALSRAIAGFAAGCAVIVFDGPETADWPSLDPQNWDVRGLTPNVRGQTPICVSIDPRDEAHSLRLALRRLERDPALRTRLGTAAHTWWRERATVDLAAAGFETLLQEALRVSDSGAADRDEGMQLAQQILEQFELTPPALGLGPSR